MKREEREREAKRVKRWRIRIRIRCQILVCACMRVHMRDGHFGNPGAEDEYRWNSNVSRTFKRVNDQHSAQHGWTRGWISANQPGN